jgi:hypothetical protein
VGVEKLNVKKNEKECERVAEKEKMQKSIKLKFQWDKLDDINNIKPKHFIHRGQ